jgi:hypothetical protein
MKYIASFVFLVKCILLFLLALYLVANEVLRSGDENSVIIYVWLLRKFGRRE